MDNTQPTLPRQETTMRTKTNKHTKIYIATLNVLTLRTEESLSELSLALQNTKWDILGLSEVRRIGENIIAYPDFILYHMGQTPGQHGVGFLVKKYLAKYIIGFYGVSERIALLNIKLPEYKDPCTIIQIYSPTEQAETETMGQFYQELNKTLQTYAHKNVIVMGDFNGQIGERQWDEDAIIGPFTYSSKPRSRNGKMLTGFAMENNLTIMNTMFKKNKNRMWTWLSPDGKSKNQIDFIMSNKPKCFTNINVINNLNFYTNHRMVRAELNSSQPKNPRPKINPEDIKLNRYLTEENVNSLNLKLKEYKRETKDAGIQEKYNWLECTIKNTIKENKTKKENSNNWISEKTTNLLEQRSALISTKRTDNNRKEIAKVSKEIKENIRKDRRQRRMETIERHIRQTGGIKKAYKELTNKKEWIVKMKNSSGIKKIGRKEILNIATDYYTELYKDNTNEREIELPDNEIIPYILQEETEKAINTQKSDKAPGPDGISNEILKQMKADLIPILTEIFNSVINTEIIPKQWTESNIILLFKKGNHCDMGNYRPISLMSNIYKTFAKVILKRIERKLDEQQPIEQAGFRRDFSVLDHIHTVRQTIEKYSEYQLTYYIAFIDYSKAFDSLIHSKIWESLKEQGIEHKYIRIIKNIYSHSTACIHLEQKGEMFQIQKGVRQGDPLSPTLFLAVLENIFRKIEWRDLGININGRSITHLRFADDIVLFAKTPDDLGKMINDLASESAKFGLKLNPEKTKIMTNGKKDPVTVEQTQISYVDEYIYLGQLISPEDNINKEVERRIANGWKKYWGAKEIMKDKNLHISTKSKLFNTCILPVLTYGSETWALTRNIANKLSTCQHAMERSMVGIKRKDKVRNSNIRSKTKVQDITLKIRRQKWKWAGHMIRGKDKWSKIITQWYPRDGKRKRGRPQRRWDDDIKQVAGTTWGRVATERREWRRLEEAFATWQTDIQNMNKRNMYE